MPCLLPQPAPDGMGQLSCPSVVTQAGTTPVTAFADLKKALAVFRSRRSLPSMSTTLPFRLIAR